MGATVALGVAAAGLAAPAGADPSAFGDLGCSCTPVPGKAPTADQVDQGIRNGLGYLHGTPPRPPSN